MKMRLLVTWAEGEAEDPRPVLVKTSWLPKLFGKDGLTLKRTIRVTSSSVLLEAPRHAPFLRHELRHVLQQDGVSLLGWLWRYATRATFRRQMEDDAREAEQVSRQLLGLPCYPRFRAV